MRRTWTLLMILLLLVSGCAAATGRSGKRSGALRLGYFANLTHAQAVLGVADGSLQRAAGVPIEAKVFPSGPTAITALLAGELDILYVGPSPAVTGYMRSEGTALRVVAGAASGGAVFVVRPGFDSTHLDGARLATPGVANTQDISLRYMLRTKGLKTREQGGSVRVTPATPADILGLFARGQLDGAWVAEPWGARIVADTGAKIAWDERDLWPNGRFATTVVVVSANYLQSNPDVVRRFLQGHVAMTRWIQAHPDDARVKLQAALAKLQGKPLPDKVMAEAFARVDFTTDPMVDSVSTQAARAYELGFLGARRPDLTGLYDLTLLREVAP